MLGWAIASVILLSCVLPGEGWTQEELDLFDLVEEVGQNFYDLMQIDQTASSSEVRRAYRQLSLQLHPDKNDEEDAAEKFRIMMAVSEVLRSEERRIMYDQVLKDGLPNWKQPLFYYRRMRKMGLMELSILLLLMLSVGHYLFRWAVFFEKQITIQDYLSRKQKRESRKSAEKGRVSKRVEKLEAEVRSMELEAQASIPRLKELLPVLLAKGLLWLGVEGWKWLSHKWRESSKKTPESEEEMDSVSDMKGKPSSKKLHHGARRRRVDGEREEDVSKELHVTADGDAMLSENQKEFDGEEVQSTSTSLVEELEDGERTSDKSHQGQSSALQSRTGSGTNSVGTCEEGSRTPLGSMAGSKEERQSSGYSSMTNLCTNNKTRNNASATKLVGTQNSPREHVRNDQDGSSQREKETDFEEKAGSNNHQHARTRRNKTLQKQHKKSQRIHDLNLATTADTGMTEHTLLALKNSKNSTTPDTQGPSTMSNGHAHTAGQGSSTEGHTSEREGSSNYVHAASQETITDRHISESEGSANSDANSDALSATRDQWTQFQQKQLEWALTQFPKFSQDRWPNIARSVPGKTQEECIQRCRQLFEDLKRKRNC